jgi:hypothetical protein
MGDVSVGPPPGQVEGRDAFGGCVGGPGIAGKSRLPGAVGETGGIGVFPSPPPE